MLLQNQILHRETCPPQGTQQTVLVEAQGLQPLGMACSHHQPSTLQPQWPAVRRQLWTGNAWPCLPKRGQAFLPSPLLLHLLQAAQQSLQWCWRRRHQQGHPALASALVARSCRHGITLGEMR